MQYLARNSFAIHLLDSLSANIAVLDSQGEIVSVNKAWKNFARENNCTDKSFYVGTNYLTICENATNIDHDETAEKALHGIREVVIGRKDSFQLEYPCNSPDERRWFICRITRLEHKGRFYIIVLHENITARKVAERALAESNELYRLLYENSIDAILLTIPDGRILVASPAACEMFGMTEEEICRVGRSGIVDNSDPRLANALAERSLTGRSSRELTGIRKDGTKFPMEVSSSIFKKADGSLRTSMIIRDITERKHAEEQIQFQAKILANVNDVVIGTDENLVITYWNPTAERIFGWKLSEISGRRTAEVLRTEFSNTDRVEFERTLSETGNWRGEVTQFTKDDKAVTFEANILAIRNASGKIMGYVAANRDITNRKQAEDELRRAKEALEATNSELQGALQREQVLARTDSLTGISNRRHFFDLAEQEFVVAKRYHQIISMIIFDIDHFKQVNDTFGHQVGDRILQRVARIARENLREADILARHGGEEFIVLLPNSNASESKVVAERIRESVAVYHLDTEHGKVNVTISIGIAELTSDADTIDDLVKRADQALYEAKEQGRNRVVIYFSS